MQAFGRNQISVQVSGVSPASGSRSGQFDPKKRLPVAESHIRCQQIPNPDTRNLKPETLSLMNKIG